MSLPARFASGTFGVLFALAGLLQWNDPDPLQWVGLYGLAAAIAFAAASGRAPRTAAIVVALAAVVWAASLVPVVLAAASFTWNEEERELGGLVLVAGWMAAVGWLARLDA